MSSLDVRMKSYEYINRTYLPRRSPIIIRIDGKAVRKDCFCEK